MTFQFTKEELKQIYSKRRKTHTLKTCGFFGVCYKLQASYLLIASFSSFVGSIITGFTKLEDKVGSKLEEKEVLNVDNDNEISGS